jgi:acyl carrier protein
MVPSSFMRLASLPRTPNGKLDRRALPEPPRAIAEPPTASLNGSSNGFLEALTTLVAQVLKVDHIDPASSLQELGVTSIEMLRLVSHIEKKFGFRPPLTDLFRLNTVAAIAGEFGHHAPDSTERVAESKTVGQDVWEEGLL